MLPYSQLFGPNALGTAELIRLALTTKQKPYLYISTIGVGDQIEPAQFTEDADIRVISPTRKIDDSYANGYANSKWAGEVLLREAHDLCGLPVAVFRCDMILADTTYAGQLNVPDMFTRMMLSLVATGIAPGSFYQLDADGNRQRAHYDGLPVEFIAEAISTLGTNLDPESDGFATYHVMNPYDDGIGFDEFVDWLIPRLTGPVLRSSASPTTATGCSGSRPRCAPCPKSSASLATAAAAQLPEAREADQWVHRAHRPVPHGGAGRENRPGQRHSTRLAADHRQVRQRPAIARAALRHGNADHQPITGRRSAYPL